MIVTSTLIVTAIRGTSTTHALIALLDKLHMAMVKLGRVFLIDFTKAFDHVDHAMLLNKLEARGVPNVLLRWKERKQRVNLGDTLSN